MECGEAYKESNTWKRACQARCLHLCPSTSWENLHTCKKNPQILATIANFLLVHVHPEHIFGAFACISRRCVHSHASAHFFHPVLVRHVGEMNFLSSGRWRWKLTFDRLAATRVPQHKMFSPFRQSQQSTFMITAFAPKIFQHLIASHHHTYFHIWATS